MFIGFVISNKYICSFDVKKRSIVSLLIYLRFLRHLFHILNWCHSQTIQLDIKSKVLQIWTLLITEGAEVNGRRRHIQILWYRKPTHVRQRYWRAFIRDRVENDLVNTKGQILALGRRNHGWVFWSLGLMVYCTDKIWFGNSQSSNLDNL